MARICTQCRRVNPNGACYCYHDGILLDGAAEFTISGGLDVASRSFPVPFVFPSGQSCRNYNELARACRADPVMTLVVLRKGQLEAFLNAQARPDLAAY